MTYLGANGGKKEIGLAAIFLFLIFSLNLAATGHSGAIERSVCCNVVEKYGTNTLFEYYRYFPGDSCPKESKDILDAMVVRSYEKTSQKKFCDYFSKPSSFSELGNKEKTGQCCAYHTKYDACAPQFGPSKTSSVITSGYYYAKGSSCNDLPFSEESSGVNYGCFYTTALASDCSHIESPICEKKVTQSRSITVQIKSSQTNIDNSIISALLRKLPQSCSLVYAGCGVAINEENLGKIASFSFGGRITGSSDTLVSATVELDCPDGFSSLEQDYDCDGIYDRFDFDANGDGIDDDKGASFTGKGCNGCHCAFASSSFPYYEPGFLWTSTRYALQLDVCINKQDTCDVNACEQVLKQLQKPGISINGKQTELVTFSSKDTLAQRHLSMSTTGGDVSLSSLETYWYSGKLKEVTSLFSNLEKIQQGSSGTIEEADAARAALEVSKEWALISCPKMPQNNIDAYMGSLLRYYDTMAEFFDQARLHILLLIDALTQQDKSCKEAIDQVQKASFVTNCGLSLDAQFISSAPEDSLKSWCSAQGRKICNADNINYCRTGTGFDGSSNLAAKNKARTCDFCIEMPCCAGDVFVAGRANEDKPGSCTKDDINPAEGICDDNGFGAGSESSFACPIRYDKMLEKAKTDLGLSMRDLTSVLEKTQVNVYKEYDGDSGQQHTYTSSSKSILTRENAYISRECEVSSSQGCDSWTQQFPCAASASANNYYFWKPNYGSCIHAVQDTRGDGSCKAGQGKKDDNAYIRSFSCDVSSFSLGSGQVVGAEPEKPCDDETFKVKKKVCDVDCTSETKVLCPSSDLFSYLKGKVSYNKCYFTNKGLSYSKDRFNCERKEGASNTYSCTDRDSISCMLKIKEATHMMLFPPAILDCQKRLVIVKDICTVIGAKEAGFAKSNSPADVLNALNDMVKWLKAYHAHYPQIRQHMIQMTECARNHDSDTCKKSPDKNKEKIQNEIKAIESESSFSVAQFQSTFLNMLDWLGVSGGQGAAFLDDMEDEAEYSFDAFIIEPSSSDWSFKQLCDFSNVSYSGFSLTSPVCSLAPHTEMKANVFGLLSYKTDAENAILKDYVYCGQGSDYNQGDYFCTQNKNDLIRVGRCRVDYVNKKTITLSDRNPDQWAPLHLSAAKKLGKLHGVRVFADDTACNSYSSTAASASDYQCEGFFKEGKACGTNGLCCKEKCVEDLQACSPADKKCVGQTDGTSCSASGCSGVCCDEKCVPDANVCGTTGFNPDNPHSSCRGDEGNVKADTSFCEIDGPEGKKIKGICCEGNCIPEASTCACSLSGGINPFGSDNPEGCLTHGIVGILVDGVCAFNSQCDDDEECDVSNCVCRDKCGEGSECNNDGDCQEGYRCDQCSCVRRPNVCIEDDECVSDDDCFESFDDSMYVCQYTTSSESCQCVRDVEKTTCSNRKNNQPCAFSDWCNEQADGLPCVDPENPNSPPIGTCCAQQCIVGATGCKAPEGCVVEDGTYVDDSSPCTFNGKDGLCCAGICVPDATSCFHDGYDCSHFSDNLVCPPSPGFLDDVGLCCGGQCVVGASYCSIDDGCKDSEEGSVCLEGTEYAGLCCAGKCRPNATSCHRLADPGDYADPDNYEGVCCDGQCNIGIGSCDDIPVYEGPQTDPRCEDVCELCHSVSTSHCHLQKGYCVCEVNNENIPTSFPCVPEISRNQFVEYTHCCSQLYNVPLTGITSDYATYTEPYMEIERIVHKDSVFTPNFANPTNKAVYLCGVDSVSMGLVDGDNVPYMNFGNCLKVEPFSHIGFEQYDFSNASTGTYELKVVYCGVRQLTHDVCIRSQEKIISYRFTLIDTDLETEQEQLAVCEVPKAFRDPGVQFDSCDLGSTGVCCDFGLEPTKSVTTSCNNIFMQDQCYGKEDNTDCPLARGKCCDEICRPYASICSAENQCFGKGDNRPCPYTKNGLCCQGNCALNATYCGDTDSCSGVADGDACIGKKGLCSNGICAENAIIIDINDLNQCEGKRDGNECPYGQGVCCDGICVPNAISCHSGGDRGDLRGTDYDSCVLSCRFSYPDPFSLDQFVCVAQCAEHRAEPEMFCDYRCIQSYTPYMENARACAQLCEEADIDVEESCYEVLAGAQTEEAILACMREKVSLNSDTVNSQIIACLDSGEGYTSRITCAKMVKGVAPQIDVTLNLMRHNVYTDIFYSTEDVVGELVIENNGLFPFIGVIDVGILINDNCHCPECPANTICQCECDLYRHKVTTLEVSLLEAGRSFTKVLNPFSVPPAWEEKTIQPHVLAIDYTDTQIAEYTGELATVIAMGQLAILDGYFISGSEKAVYAYPGDTLQGHVVLHSELFPINVTVTMLGDSVALEETKQVYSFNAPVEKVTVVTSELLLEREYVQKTMQLEVMITDVNGNILEKKVLLEQFNPACAGSTMTTGCVSALLDVKPSYPIAFVEVKPLQLSVEEVYFTDRHDILQIEALTAPKKVQATVYLSNNANVAFSGTLYVYVVEKGMTPGQGTVTEEVVFVDALYNQSAVTTPIFTAELEKEYYVYVKAIDNEGVSWYKDMLDTGLFPYAQLSVIKPPFFYGVKKDIRVNYQIGSCVLSVMCPDCPQGCDLSLNPDKCEVKKGETCLCECSFANSWDSALG